MQWHVAHALEFEQSAGFGGVLLSEHCHVCTGDELAGGGWLAEKTLRASRIACMKSPRAPQEGPFFGAAKVSRQREAANYPRPKLQWLYDPERRAWRCLATVRTGVLHFTAHAEPDNSEPGFDPRAIEQECLEALLILTEGI